jgi:hypothetical protein
MFRKETGDIYHIGAVVHKIVPVLRREKGHAAAAG